MELNRPFYLPQMLFVAWFIDAGLTVVVCSFGWFESDFVFQLFRLIHRRFVEDADFPIFFRASLFPVILRFVFVC
jgi:hypothetical protein